MPSDVGSVVGQHAVTTTSAGAGYRVVRVEIAEEGCCTGGLCEGETRMGAQPSGPC